MARPRAADYDDKRDAILVGAARALAEQGHRASMSDIARGCGVSKALLYHYYESKEALIFDIVRRHLDALEAALEAADDAEREPRERLRALVRATLRTYRDSDDQHRVQLDALGHLPEDQAEKLREVERRIVRRFSEVLRGVNPVLAGDKRLTPVTMSLFGMMNWVYMWFRPDGPVGRDEYADLATHLILTGVTTLGRDDRQDLDGEARGRPLALDRA